MACEHKRIKSVNCVIFCADCGARLEKPKAESRAPSADAPGPIAYEMEPKNKPVRKTAKRTKAD